MINKPSSLAILTVTLHSEKIIDSKKYKFKI